MHPRQAAKASAIATRAFTLGSLAPGEVESQPAHQKRDELREGRKLHEDTAAAAALDLEAELAKVGLTPAQREKLHRALPALARTLPDRR